MPSLRDFLDDVSQFVDLPLHVTPLNLPSLHRLELIVALLHRREVVATDVKPPARLGLLLALHGRRRLGPRVVAPSSRHARLLHAWRPSEPCTLPTSRSWKACSPHGLGVIAAGGAAVVASLSSLALSPALITPPNVEVAAGAEALHVPGDISNPAGAGAAITIVLVPLPLPIMTGLTWGGGGSLRKKEYT